MNKFTQQHKISFDVLIGSKILDDYKLGTLHEWDVFINIPNLHAPIHLIFYLN